MIDLERAPDGEAEQIEQIVALTRAQLKRRYTDKNARVLRGVHPKSHGCVAATFTLSKTIPENLRVGVFAQPGHKYEAVIRFSNAAALVTADSAVKNGKINHGSRGMAIKLIDVDGVPLMPTGGPPIQDFLLINQPAFAFANVVDYLALSDILQKNNDDASRFFERVKDPDPKIRATTIKTAGIAGKIASPIGPLDPPPPPPAPGQPPTPVSFQQPPLSPLDNRYFSGSPFLFGEGRAAKFSARPVAPKEGSPTDVSDPDYLRHALHERLTGDAAKDVVFTFEVQVRDAASLEDTLDPDIENASFVWDEAKYPFVPVGEIRIPPQEFDTPELVERCERLIFSPWHGITEHRPLGGINRLRKAVYDASSVARGASSPGGDPIVHSPDGGPLGALLNKLFK